MDAARERGALGALAVANTLACWGLIMLGDHAGGYAMAGEAVELGEAAGYLSELAAAHLALAEEEACARAARRGVPVDRRARTGSSPPPGWPTSPSSSTTPRRSARRAGATTQRVVAILEPLARAAAAGAWATALGGARAGRGLPRGRPRRGRGDPGAPVRRGEPAAAAAERGRARRPYPRPGRARPRRGRARCSRPRGSRSVRTCSKSAAPGSCTAPGCGAPASGSRRGSSCGPRATRSRPPT